MRLTESQQDYARQLEDACRRLGAEAEPDTHQSEAASRHLAERGLLGPSLPAEYGGGGRTFVEDCILLEKTQAHGVPLTAYSTALTAAQTYLKYGNDAQRRTAVTAIRAGRVESIAYSEPDAGSDLARVTTRAVRDGDEWVIDGRKTWISFAHIADHMLVLARTDDSGDYHAGMTFIMVPTDLPGIEIREIKTMAPRMPNDVWFRGVRVPVANTVGVEGEAWNHLRRGLAVERLIIGAMTVGGAQRALDDLIAWVTNRVQFGRPLSKLQAVRHRIADLAAQIDVVRAYVYDIADRIDQGLEDELNGQASIAKLTGSEIYKKAALEAVQLMGGYGYSSEWGMEQQLRTAIAPTIYGGSNEVQRDIIAKSIGL